MDNLDDVLPNWPRCLHRRELDGELDAFVWLCDCGVAVKALDANRLYDVRARASQLRELRNYGPHPIGP